MASSCDIYKGGIKLGSGTCSGGSASITSYTANDSGGLSGDVARVAARKNVTIVVTQTGTYKGMSWRARVLTQGATTTLQRALPVHDGMKANTKVDHKCSVPPMERQWDRLESKAFAPTGQALHEIWKCRSCGYEFELPRAWKTSRRMNAKMH